MNVGSQILQSDSSSFLPTPRAVDWNADAIAEIFGKFAGGRRKGKIKGEAEAQASPQGKPTEPSAKEKKRKQAALFELSRPLKKGEKNIDFFVR